MPRNTRYGSKPKINPLGVSAKRDSRLDSNRAAIVTKQKRLAQADALWTKRRAVLIPKFYAAVDAFNAKPTRPNFGKVQAAIGAVEALGFKPSTMTNRKRGDAFVAGALRSSATFKRALKKARSLGITPHPRGNFETMTEAVKAGVKTGAVAAAIVGVGLPTVASGVTESAAGSLIASSATAAKSAAGIAAAVGAIGADDKTKKETRTMLQNIDGGEPELAQTVENENNKVDPLAAALLVAGGVAAVNIL